MNDTNISEDRRIKHGGHKTRLYRIWACMKNRCSDPNCTSYKRYGGRGITVCDAWQNDFVPFRDWALKNGYSKELTLDRINNDKGYCPENCRWATKKEQQRNTSKALFVTLNGVTKSLGEWADITGIKRNVLRGRIFDCGWPIEKALTTPIKRYEGAKEV